MRVVTFPGQGLPQGTPMLGPFSHLRAHVGELCEQLNQAMDNPRFADYLFEPPGQGVFEKSRFLQPAMLASAVMLGQMVAREYKVDLVGEADALVGHSLGEYTALAVLLPPVADGGVLFGEWVELVHHRGLWMEQAAAGHKEEFKMAAVLLRDKAQLFDAMEVLGDEYEVLSSFNSPRQVVVSGVAAQVEAAVEAFVGNYASKRERPVVKVLPASVPFHTQFLEPAEVRLREAVAVLRENRGDARLALPVYTNLAGFDYQTLNDALRLVVQTTCRPVQFTKCVEAIEREGRQSGAGVEYVHMGPGAVLEPLVRQTAGDGVHYSLATPQGLEAYLASRQ